MAQRSSYASRPGGAGSVVQGAASLAGPRLVLLVSVIALVVIGLLMVYSAGSIEAIADGDTPEAFLVKQLIATVAGIACAAVLWLVIPYRFWAGPATWAVWGVAVALLIATPLIGTDAGMGAIRWIVIGPVSIQPSEFAKVAFVLVMARILFDFRNGELAPKGLAIQIVVLVLLPLLFLYRSQSDLGTTLICVVGILMVLWAGEVPLSIILAIVGAGVLFALYATFGAGYREDRLIFLDPWQDATDAGYQLIHSFYAFAEGGLFGVGVGNSSEKFLYLPEAETDFIFAVVGEELGLVGALLVILLFLALLWAGIRIGAEAHDSFGAMVAQSLTVMIVFQAFLNIFCVVGLAPTTGKPLPFISSGASSMLASLIMIGLVLAVSREGGGVPNVYEQRRQDLRILRVREGGAGSPGRRR